MDIIAIINEEVSRYDQILKLKGWYKQENEKLDQIKDYKEWKYKTDRLMKIYLKKMNELTKGEDPYELGGDMDSKYIYHYTDESSLLGMLDDDMIVTGESGISFSSDSNLYKRGFVFWYPGKYSEGRHHGNTGIKIKFDFGAMKSSGLKFRVGNENIGTHSGEREIRYRGDEIENISKYIVEVIIFKNKIKDGSLDNIKSKLDNLRIRYKVV